MKQNPITLIFALSTKSMYRPTLYSENEIFCSPNEIDRFENGRPVTLNAPLGEFPIETILKRLPTDCEPELLVAKVDATLACVPRGIAVLSCPKVLIAGAPHQFSWPLTSLLKYQRLENFDLVVSDHDRHHMHWFKRLGCPRVYWLPALNFCLREQPINEPTEKSALFIGQTGKFHPYRSEMFRRLERRGIPMTIRVAKPDETGELYAKHAIALNGSLNGDLNLRVFEVLGSGGFCLTDRLSYDSGLEMLFADGEEIALYDGQEDLASKIKHYLANPDEAMSIRKKGHARLMKEHHPDLKRRQFLELAFEGREEPMFVLDDERILSLAARPESTLFEEVAIYEYLQELHLRAISLIVFGSGAVLPFCEDLPRLRYYELSECSKDIDTDIPHELNIHRFLVISSVDVDFWSKIIESFVGDFVIVLPELDGTEPVNEMLANNGFAAVEGRRGFFEIADVLLASARFAAVGANFAAREKLANVDTSSLSLESLFSVAQIAQSCQDMDTCVSALEQCLGIDRSLGDVYFALATIARERNDKRSEWLYLTEADRVLGTLPDDASELLSELELDRPASFPELEAYRKIISIGSNPSLLNGPRRILIYTNLFPPQELGGYGRKMWEFAYELIQRGHEVKILAGDAPYLWKDPSEDETILEQYVERCLELSARWENGTITHQTDGTGALTMMQSNTLKVMQAVDEWEPDLCLLGNIDIIGYQVIEQLGFRDIPMVHCVGNPHTSCPKDFRPKVGMYVLGPASRFTGELLETEGFAHNRWEVLYPGARIDRFYRYFMPRLDIPRIVFAGLLMPYKGPQTLLDALVHLKNAGLEFRAIIAGDSTLPEFIDALKKTAQDAGFADWIEFPGFLDRRQLADAFCRSNIMVFPSIVKEAFGISQVEALASGLTLVSSGQGGAAEIVRDEVDSLVFEAGNGMDLAKKLASLVADPERWKRLALAGRERSLDFAIPRTVDTIETLFQEMEIEII